MSTKLKIKFKQDVRDVKGRFAKAFRTYKLDVNNVMADELLNIIDKTIDTYPSGKRKYTKASYDKQGKFTGRRYKAYVKNALSRRLFYRGDWKYISDKYLHESINKYYYVEREKSKDKRYSHPKKQGPFGWTYSAADYWENIRKPGSKRFRKILQDTGRYRRSWGKVTVNADMLVYNKILEGEMQPPYYTSKLTGKMKQSSPLYPLFLEEGTNQGGKAYKVLRKSVEEFKSTKLRTITKFKDKYRTKLIENFER